MLDKQRHSVRQTYIWKCEAYFAMNPGYNIVKFLKMIGCDLWLKHFLKILQNSFAN